MDPQGKWQGLDLVFIAPAFNKIGEFLFGDKWRGTEGYAELAQPLPDLQILATFDQLKLAEMALKRHHAGLNGRRPTQTPAAATIGGLGGMGGYKIDPPNIVQDLSTRFHDDDWRAARSIVDGWVEIRDAAVERRCAVVEWLSARIADDRTLRVVLRDPETANQVQGPEDHWNQHWQFLERRWLQGRYYFQAPFAPAGVSQVGWREVSIFLVRDELNALLQQPPAQSSTSQAPPDLPATGTGATLATALVKLTKPMFNLHTALVAEMGDDGGEASFKTAQRKERAQAWRLRQEKPLPIFPGALDRAILHLNKKVFCLLSL